MTSAAFDFAPLLPAGLPAAAAKWTGLAKYSFVGGNNDPESFWRLLRAQAQIVDTNGDSYRALRLAEAALFHAQRVRSRLGAARVQQLLATLCEKVGLGNKAERYRQAAITEIRSLGDRRATAELLLTDLPTPGAVVMPNRIQDAMTLTKEIGWTEGHERAKRKSNPSTNVKS